MNIGNTYHSEYYLNHCFGLSVESDMKKGTPHSLLAISIYLILSPLIFYQRD